MFTGNDEYVEEKFIDGLRIGNSKNTAQFSGGT
jgi:hypothetical protein